MADSSARASLDDDEIRPAGEPRLVGVDQLKVDVDVRDHF
jgi:hypothetical protein